MEVENKGKPPSFPSNYVTIHQLRQRWLQQQQSPSLLPTTVIPVSNHRDNGDVIESSSSSAAASKTPPQNDAVSAHSSTPPPVTKSPSSYNTNNKDNNKPPFSSISSSSSSGGGFKKNPQNGAVSPPPAKTKSPSSSSSQQQQQSPSSSSSSSLLLPTTVIPVSNHRDNGDVVDSSSPSTDVSQKPQNDAVSARSPPPPVTKSPSSYNTNNRASVESSSASKKPSQNDTVSARFSKPPSSYYSKNKAPFSSISSSSSGGSFNKKPQSDAVLPSPSPAKTKSSSPLISQQNPQNRIVSKTLKETIFGKGRGPHRAPTPQKPELEPEPEPEHTDSIVVTTTTNNNTLGTDSANDVTDKPISVSNDNQVLKKKKRKNKKKNLTRVLPDQNVTGANSLSETDPKPDLEVVVGEKQESGESDGGRKPNKEAVREMKMGQELEEVVEVEKKQRGSRGSRNWDRKGVREFKDKTASFYQNKNAVREYVVEPEAVPELEVKMEVESVVVEKEKESGELGGSEKSNKMAVRELKMGQELDEVVVEKKQQQQLRKSRGCRDWNKNRVKEFKDKTALFDQNKQAVGDDNVVEPEAEPELEVKMEVVVWKGQESPELSGSVKSNKKATERESKMAQELEDVADNKQIPMETRGRRAVWKYKTKTASFGQYDSTNSNKLDNNVDVGGGGGGKAVEDDKIVGNVDVGGGGGGVKAVEDEKVVANGDVVKENSTRGSGKLDHQGKQSLKPASFDQDQDMSESAVKERGAVNTNYNNNYNGGSNWRMGYGRFRGQGIQRPSYSKPLVSTRKGEVWVKKGESIKPNLSSS